VRNHGAPHTILASAQPAGPPLANWLPVPRVPSFSVILRIYGPTGNTAPTASPAYNPPAITPIG